MARFLIVFVLGFLCSSLSLAADEKAVKKFPAPKDGKLTTEMLNFYEENGFLVLENFISKETADTLKARAKVLARKHHTNNKEEFQIFFSGESIERKDAYFFDSIDKIRPFYEKGAVDEGGIVLYYPEDSMNKLAHAVHARDESFRAFSTQEMVKNLVSSLSIKSPVIIQSMILFKPARIGSAVKPHQDAAFLFTKPQSLTGFWVALEPASKINGCLEVIPGGHDTSKLYARFVLTKNADSKAAEFVDQVDMGWKDTDFVPLEVEPGTLILLHGMLPHKSNKNTSEMSRNAYAFHVISDEADYSPKNWMQNPEKVALSSVKVAAASS